MTNSSGSSIGANSTGAGTPDPNSTSTSTSTSAHEPEPEPERQKLERNWSELLQELRVVHTGTQILTGFLLTLPFQARFSSLTSFQLTVYLFLVLGAVLATALALTPVAVHRALFRHGAKAEIVNTGSRIAVVTLGVVSLVLTGTVTFVFDVVLGDSPALIVGSTALVVLLCLWVLLPLAVRPRARKLAGEPPGAGRSGPEAR